MSTAEASSAVPLSVLLLEDDPRDAELTVEALSDAGYDCVVTRVADREAFVGALEGNVFDVILADYALPQFDGVSALQIAVRKAPVTPFIFVSGAIGEERAIETLRSGCTDYVLKHRLERIGPAVTRALREVRGDSERREALEALRQSEESFRLIAEMVPQMIWTSDAQGRTTYTNQRLRDYAGAEMTGDTWQRLIHPDDTGPTVGQWQQAMLHGHPFAGEVRLRRHDGTYRWFLVRAEPSHDEHGATVAWFGTATDVDEARRAIDMARQAKEELERATQAKDEFLAAISHELRTPLTSILGWASLLRGEPDPGLLSTGIDSILTSARVQAQLIDDLLDASRLMVGKMPIRFEPADLREVIRAAADTVFPSANARHVALHITLPEQPLVAQADRQRVQQVIWNLLTNAVKFTPAGGLVDVTAELAGAHVVITVHDTGAGISAEFLPMVFHRFTQERAGVDGGLGLGLAISQQLASLHGGTLTAASDGQGKGATFTLTLPVTGSSK